MYQVPPCWGDIRLFTETHCGEKAEDFTPVGERRDLVRSGTAAAPSDSPGNDGGRAGEGEGYLKAPGY